MHFSELFHTIGLDVLGTHPPCCNTLGTSFRWISTELTWFFLLHILFTNYLFPVFYSSILSYRFRICSKGTKTIKSLLQLQESSWVSLFRRMNCGKSLTIDYDQKTLFLLYGCHDIIFHMVHLFYRLSGFFHFITRRD